MNFPGTLEESTKKVWLVNYIASKYLISEPTAKEYANIIINRPKFNFPDISKTNPEIMDSKGGYWDLGKKTKERVKREEAELSSSHGNVAEVQEENE